MRHHTLSLIASLLTGVHICGKALAIPGGSKSVIVQMFQWNWDSIAAECTNFLGPAGYGFVQISPPQEHVQGSQWWTDYQPVSYALTSKRGTKAQLSNMIATCHTAGVGVIADTVLNHMAGVDSGVGIAGEAFTHYSYPPLYSSQNFHYCGLEPGNTIVNYSSRIEVQTCQLENLADLATETEYVRAQLAGYVNDLLEIGITGLRLDAAKHISSADLQNISSRFTTRPYITQEVIWGAADAVQPSEYVGIGDVQEFAIFSSRGDAFLTAGVSALHSIPDPAWTLSNVANGFVANHDTERNGGSLNYNSPSNTYLLAMIFTLAHPYSTQSILSSYAFAGIDDGAPTNGTAACAVSGGANGWLCQHRWPAVAGLVAFRNAVGGQPLTNWINGSSQQIAFSRGSAGFVAINNADTVWKLNAKTGLPAGSYCNVAGGVSTGPSCAGASFTVVTGGGLNTTVPTRSAIALFTGAQGSSRTVTVNFAENAQTTFGDNIFVVGNLTQLGQWMPASAIPLSAAAYPVWTSSVQLPPGVGFQYKYIRKTSSGAIVWEPDPNRSATAPTSGSSALNDTWR